MRGSFITFWEGTNLEMDNVILWRHIWPCPPCPCPNLLKTGLGHDIWHLMTLNYVRRHEITWNDTKWHDMTLNDMIRQIMTLVLNNMKGHEITFNDIKWRFMTWSDMIWPITKLTLNDSWRHSEAPTCFLKPLYSLKGFHDILHANRGNDHKSNGVKINRGPPTLSAKKSGPPQPFRRASPPFVDLYIT
jgi:hypothetical protein